MAHAEERDAEIERAVEELHEPDRLCDLLLGHLHERGAPRELVALFERGRMALQEWQER